MDRTEALNKLMAFAKSRAEELRVKADKEHLDDFDLQAAERMAAELDEAATVVESGPCERIAERAAGMVCVEVDAARCDILDRALTGYAKSLEAARDMGVIKHETFCAKADKARAMQYMIWGCQEALKAKAG